jgi:c-di-GMP-binding flagellar brake protein YcgR
MNLAMLERRNDPRIQASVPIKLRYETADDETPAHLVDLSCGGAAIHTTELNAPAIGQRLTLNFVTPAGENDSEDRVREETGVVINLQWQEKDVARAGIRFLHHRDNDSGIFDPNPILVTHRKSMPVDALGKPRETARNFTRRETASVN